ncbi:MAG: OmpA family protein [Gemmatimonadetes bacterium]|nr:OmpA family protein [Gemmatimonadota bacterium]
MDSLQRYNDSVAAAAEEARRRAEEEAAARRAEEARQRAIREARETLMEMVNFAYDESEIEAEAAGILRAKVAILRASPQVQLRIEGHADERGSTEYNLALGNRRAESVRQFLTGFGLAENRFAIVSFGESRPMVQASNEQAWAQNRRAEFVITAGMNTINPPSN